LASPEEIGEAEDNEPDWGEVFTELLCHTSLDYEGICERTIPQIVTIHKNLGKHIEIKIGFPGLFGFGMTDASTTPVGLADKPPKLSEIIGFAERFNKT